MSASGLRISRENLAVNLQTEVIAASRSIGQFPRLEEEALLPTWDQDDLQQQQLAAAFRSSRFVLRAASFRESRWKEKYRLRNLASITAFEDEAGLALSAVKLEATDTLLRQIILSNTGVFPGTSALKQSVMRPVVADIVTAKQTLRHELGLEASGEASHQAVAFPGVSLDTLITAFHDGEITVGQVAH